MLPIEKPATFLHFLETSNKTVKKAPAKKVADIAEPIFDLFKLAEAHYKKGPLDHEKCPLYFDLACFIYASSTISALTPADRNEVNEIFAFLDKAIKNNTLTQDLNDVNFLALVAILHIKESGDLLSFSKVYLKYTGFKNFSRSVFSNAGLKFLDFYFKTLTEQRKFRDKFPPHYEFAKFIRPFLIDYTSENMEFYEKLETTLCMLKSAIENHSLTKEEQQDIFLFLIKLLKIPPSDHKEFSLIFSKYCHPAFYLQKKDLLEKEAFTLRHQIKEIITSLKPKCNFEDLEDVLDELLFPNDQISHRNFLVLRFVLGIESLTDKSKMLHVAFTNFCKRLALESNKANVTKAIVEKLEEEEDDRFPHIESILKEPLPSLHFAKFMIKTGTSFSSTMEPEYPDHYFDIIYLVKDLEKIRSENSERVYLKLVSLIHTFVNSAETERIKSSLIPYLIKGGALGFLHITDYFVKHLLQATHIRADERLLMEFNKEAEAPLSSTKTDAYQALMIAFARLYKVYEEQSQRLTHFKEFERTNKKEVTLDTLES